jgi:PIN domain nuclease of toxin-antitoxin system
VKLLLDTHLLIWAAQDSPSLSLLAREMISDTENDLYFSVVSLWEIVIKTGRGKPDFKVDAAKMRRDLLKNGYVEMPVISSHAIAVSTLPALHKDPFDRLLIAQAMTEGITLLTVDPAIVRYPGPIRKV